MLLPFQLQKPLLEFPNFLGIGSILVRLVGPEQDDQKQVAGTVAFGGTHQRHFFEPVVSIPTREFASQGKLRIATL